MNQGEELRYLILAAQREGNRRLTEALKPLSLTPAQAEVIAVLQRHPMMTLLQLGQHLVCETSSPSRLVSGMVESGWVEKLPNPHDSRALMLRLTPKAQAILPRLNEIEQAFNAHITSTLTGGALTGMIEQLWTLIADTPSAEALQNRKDAGD